MTKWYIWLCVSIIILILLFIIIRHIRIRNIVHTSESYADMLDDKLYTVNHINRINLPVLYINMDVNTDRRENMEHQLNQYNIRHIRIPGVVGNNITNMKEGEIDGIRFINLFDDKVNKKFTKPEIGCTLSHIKAIKYAYDNNMGTVCIAEDDISFKLMPFWDQNIQDLLDRAPKDWDIIQLYTNTCKIKDEFVHFNDNMCYGTVFYVINKKGQEQIMNLFKDGILRFVQHSDDDHIGSDFFIYRNVENAYAYQVPLFFTNNGYKNLNSTIHPEHNINHMSRSNEIIKHYLNKTNDMKKINGKYVIWACWTGKNKIPDYLKLCHDTVKKYNDPFYNVILITPDNIDQYVTKFHPAYEYLSYVHKADYLRCELLHTYGGIYIDMDTICFRDLRNIFDYSYNNSVIGYDGSRWKEIWGMSVMGPIKPGTIYTFKWYNKLHQVLDNRLSDLKKFRQENPNELNKDCLNWTEILREIVLPISIELKNQINYHLIIDDWFFVNEDKILSKDDIDSSKIQNILVLNNASYPDTIRNATTQEIKNNKDNILLFKLLNYSLSKEIIMAMPYIDKIFYINLDKRKDRNEQVSSELTKYFNSKAIKRFSAIEDSNGAVGCLKSHIMMLEDAKKNIYDGENVMFCEDDIIFTENPKPYIEHFFNNPILKDWNVLMLAHNTSKSKETSDSKIIKILSSQTTACFIVKYSYISTLLNVYKQALDKYLQTGKWKDDYCTDRAWKKLQGPGEWFTFKDRICKQREGYSDIEKRNTDYGV